MDEAYLMTLVLKMGWKESQGHWWHSTFEPMQNTWTWDKVKKEVFG